MHYKVEALVESDREEEQLAMFIEGLLEGSKWHFKTKDLSVYEVTYFA